MEYSSSSRRSSHTQDSTLSPTTHQQHQQPLSTATATTTTLTPSSSSPSPASLSSSSALASSSSSSSLASSSDPLKCLPASPCSPNSVQSAPCEEYNHNTIRNKLIDTLDTHLRQLSTRTGPKSDPIRPKSFSPSINTNNDIKCGYNSIQINNNLNKPKWSLQSVPMLVTLFTLYLHLFIISNDPVSAQYRPKWPSPIVQREIFLLNLEDGYFGCQVNESTDFLQLFELSKLCDGVPQCFLGSDELALELKCGDRNHCHPKMPKCLNGACLDNLCYCNDGFGGKGCDLPDENECKYRPCDVFAHCTNTLGSFYCSCFPGYEGDGFTCHDVNECEVPALAGLCAENAECCNLPGHFVCKCKEGFTGNATQSCTDIDECADKDTCGRGAECHNTPGGYACHCPAGFTGDPSKECWDIDECKANACGEGAICTNLPGNFECTCPTGFRGNPTPELGCVDVNECAQTDRQLCGTNATCVNTVGSYFCQCPQGYTGNSRISCIDVDECVTNACGLNTLCTNTLGGYSCQCKQGFSGDPFLSAGCSDINECLEANSCGRNAKCYNTAGSFECACEQGYTGNPLTACIDIDECLANPCGPGAVCTNVPGSFRCDCPIKYSPRGTPDVGCERAAVDVPCQSDLECTDNAFCDQGECRCRAGFQPRDIDCTDIDECKTQRNVCGSNAKCFNSPGGFRCECKPGFEKINKSQATSKCRDINECVFGPKPCGGNATCINSDGSYKCVCVDGFIGNPKKGCKSPCEGIVCSAHASCQVKGNEAACVCDAGYTYDPSNISSGCVDINECDTGPFGLCGQNALCVNTIGSHQCQCPSGFTGDPFTFCEPLPDVCATIECGPSAVCRVSGERPECICSSESLEGNPYDLNKGCYPPICSNDPDCSEDELCELLPAGYRDCGSVCKGFTCGPNAICRGKDHKPFCECRPNFRGDPHDTKLGCQPPIPTCSDDTECPDAQSCQRQENGLKNCTDVCSHTRCGHNAHCVGREHASACECLPGFVGDSLHGCQKPPQNLCEDDSSCKPDKACILTIEGIKDCVDVCFGHRCQVGASCVGHEHRPVCECLPGYTRQPGSPPGVCIYNLCRTDSECSESEVCAINRKGVLDCISACRGIRCGSNAECVAKNHEAFCKCKEGFDGNPDDLIRGCPPADKCRSDGDCGSTEVCRLNQNGVRTCVDACIDKLCGPNSICSVSNHFAVCSCNEGFTGKPDNKAIGCQPIAHECTGEEFCPSNAVCVPSPEGINVCRDACEKYLCGENALCVATGHKPSCTCRPGFVGDPFHRCTVPDECQSDDNCYENSVCRSDTSGTKKCALACLYAKCAPDAACVGTGHKATCVCPPGHTGDPYNAAIGCQPLQANLCETDADCPISSACRRTETGSMDCRPACDGIQCGPNARCKAINHIGTCQCLPDHTGDPSNIVNGCRKREQNECDLDPDCSRSSDVCKPMNNGVKKCFHACKFALCGPNSECVATNHTYFCDCKEGFLRDQNGFCVRRDDECREDIHCPDFQTCRPNSVGILKCTDVCADFTCTPNSRCVAIDHRGQCQCEPNYTGDPGSRQGCTPIPVNECTADEDCVDLNAVCFTDTFGVRRCVDPCATIQCNANATCQSANRRAQCICADGVCPVVRCSRDRDCPLGEICSQKSCQTGCRADNDCPNVEACMNNQCIDPCASRTACGTNAVCRADNHEKICSCGPGTEGNPRIECVRQSRFCTSSDECRNGEHCEADVCRFECNDDNGCFDNEKCTDGFCTSICKTDDSCAHGFVCDAGQCKPGCRSDSECPASDACMNRKCIAVCASPLACGSNAVCQSINHSPWCTCPPRYTGNPRLECKKIECVLDTDCPTSTICINYKCTSGFNGTAACRSDAGCRPTESCISLQCTDPCRFSGVCGENAVCKVVDHQPVCSCEEPLTGNPLIRCTTPVSDDSIMTCNRDSDCPADRQCLDDRCVARYECSEDKECHVGYICITGKCFAGCRADADCALDQGCFNRQCQNPCNLRTSCGINAQCTPYNHKAKCSCSSGYTGNPLVACTEIPICRRPEDCPVGYTCVNSRCSVVSGCASDHECNQGEICDNGKCREGCRSHADCDFTSACIDSKCSNPCNYRQCGNNGVCYPINHDAVCRCPEGFFGDPYQSCAVKQEDCKSDTDCGDGKICISSRCSIGCQSDANCAPDKACIQGKCRDPCSGSVSCGYRALCRPVNHRAECACPPNFVGDPRVLCSEKAIAQDVECSSDESCGSGQKCRQNHCVKEEPACYGDTGCSPGEICESGNCIVGCRRDGDCTYDKACFNNKCINPCTVQTACGQNADCHPVVHRPQCTCKPKHTGNPYDYCKPTKEPPPPECSDDKGCALGKICEQGKCFDGCRFDENCPHDKACINRQCLNPCDFPDSCGDHATCTPVKHRPLCSCSSGFTGDASIRCHPIVLPVCLHDVDCGTGQICENGKCIDACRTDDTCPYTEACINRRCQDPCSVFGACGRNALCRPENHRAVCSCPDNFRGEANLFCERVETQNQISCVVDRDCEFNYICELGNCLEGCRKDEQCTPDKTCYNRVCKDPCSFTNACGANTNCLASSHRPVCSCKNGFVGDPHIGCRPVKDEELCQADADCGYRLICDANHCVAGCRDNQGCSFGESCINRLCQNPCSFFGACGRNADCKPFNHTAVCSCPPSHKGNPNLVCTEAPPQCLHDSECVLGQICENTQCISGCRHDNNCPEDKACINGACENPCLLPNACGHNTVCQPYQHRPRCECQVNFRGNPFSGCDPIPDDYCENDSSCPLGKICENNKCENACRNDGNCKFDESCINKICQNPCSIYGACGPNAICKPVNHDRLCTCKPDHTGDPKILCERIQPPPECLDDTQCPLEHICQNTHCSRGCRTSANCPSDKTCIRGKCADPCSASGACGEGAICSAANHVAVCSCPSGFRGDPDVECREIPPECRYDADCGLERICLKQKCLVGCRTHSNCPFDKACVNGLCQSPCNIGGMCGVNTICRAENHEAQCTCVPGYTGDPLRQCTKIFVECETDTDCGSGYVCAHQKCKDINECLQEVLPCGPGASCQNLPGWYKCSCPLPLVGNAYGKEGCRPSVPICFHDADCKDDQKCNPVTQECYDVCSKPGICGKGALCRASNSKAECECLPGYRGNPYVECSIRDSCSSPSDCPGNLLCLGQYCGCPYPYKQRSSFCILSSLNCTTNNPCPTDQICVYADRGDSVGHCACPKGFMMTLEGTCRDYNECEEKAFPCGPGAKCMNKVGSYDCRCPTGTTGDPYVSGCSPEQQLKQCFHDSDCPDDRSCIDFKCHDSCLASNNCGQNAVCYIEGHRRKCKCRTGFAGNPIEICRPISDCVTDSGCPGNLACLRDHRCGCPIEFNRILDYCVRFSYNCSTTNPCPDNQECIYSGTESGFCVCPRGFTLRPDGVCEDINECNEKNICGPHASCVNRPGTYECRCAAGYQGEDPYRDGCSLMSKEPPGCLSDHDCPLTKKCDSAIGQCFDPCTTRGANKCGVNAICQTNNHMSTCLCPSGFEGNPNKLCSPIQECGVTYQCSGNLICLNSRACGCPPNYFRENDYCLIRSQNCTTTNPCPLNEECVYTGERTGFCVCPHGYELTPRGECKEIRICETDNPCASGAICRDRPGSYVCVCPVDTIGDPYVKGCNQVFGCQTDADCPLDKECDTGSKQCISPCHTCGPNAECTVRDHKAVCVCAPGRVGQPDDKEIGCFVPPPPPDVPTVRTIPPVQDLTVMCLAEGVQVGVRLGGYDGIIYVKGHSQDPNCRRLVSNQERESIDFKVGFGQCGLIHVNGEASFILVVQKHPKLVTYRARAYHIKCMYMSGERTVTLGFNVSMITTSGTIANTGPPPTCLMSITSIDGKEVSSAEIGDDLLLKVDVQPDFIYGGFARSCVAKTMEDEGEFQYEVTDANGCASDPSIFGNWEYDPHKKTLMARFNAFKFPSSNNLRFQCNIRVCFGSCPPVNCDGVDAYGKRRRREVKDEDLLLTDAFKEGALREEIMVQSNAILTFEKRDPQPSPSLEGQRIEDVDHVCLPKLGLIISMILTTLLALVAVAVAISCWLMAYRRKPRRQGPLPHPPDFPNPLYTTPEPVTEPSPDYYHGSHL